MRTVTVPLTVPPESKSRFIENYQAITQGTEHLFLFSCDQKIEHLNQDFYSYASPHPQIIHTDAMNPEHLFAIAQQGRVGAMATHLGLLSRYAPDYPTINYIVKLNGKTNLVPLDIADPLSAPLATVADVVSCMQNQSIPIRGIGITVYLGSTYEDKMLSFASTQITQAHEQGLVTIIWMYPRGKAIADDQSHELTAGAVGVAASLGADFVKIKTPRASKELSSIDVLHIAVAAAGNSKIICAGGAKIAFKDYLNTLYDQIHKGGTAGTATGRNIFQNSRIDAIAMTHAIAAMVYDGKTPEEAYAIFEQARKK